LLPKSLFSLEWSPIDKNSVKSFQNRRRYIPHYYHQFQTGNVDQIATVSNLDYSFESFLSIGDV